MSLLKSLKGQILALSSACLVLALLVLTVANFLVARSQARDSLIEESLATAKSHVETIEEWGRGKALIVAASVTAFDEPEPVKTLALLRDAGKFSTFYFGFADKKYVFSETRNLPADYDPTARPWYKQAAAAGGPVITPPYISASDGKLVVTFASPVGAGSALKGWLRAMCPWSPSWPPWHRCGPRPRASASWRRATARSLPTLMQRSHSSP